MEDEIMERKSREKVRPFYALPDSFEAPSKIINEARTSVRAVVTKRPFTPRDDKRTLFPSSTLRNPESRPASAFSLNSKHFDGNESRPVSGTRLTPLEHTPRFIPSEVDSAVRPPSSQGSRPPSSHGRPLPRKNSRSRLNLDGGDEQLQVTANVANTGSATRREKVDENLQYFNEYVSPILEEMSSLEKKKDADKLILLAEELYNVLEKNDCLHKHNKQRPAILKTVFRLLDVDEPKVLLKLARIILAFKVSGNNLISACKLVFKVSRHEKNDNEFLDGKITELLLETIKTVDPETCCEALIYCVGAIKFLTGNSVLLKQLTRKECIETLSRLLHKINKSNRENGQVNDQFGHILVQLAAAMRNLADVGSSRERMFKSHFIDEVIPLMETYTGDSDLMHYISRILSKITMHSDCVAVLCEQPNCFKSFITLLKRHMNIEALVVRLCFVLGNVTAKRDDSRLKLFQESEEVGTFLEVLKLYQSKYKQSLKDCDSSKGRGSAEANKTKRSEYEDVLVKVIRVVANLSINEVLGPQIASNEELVGILLTVLDENGIEESEELVLNTIITISNLSYYTCKSNAVTAKQIPISRALLKTLSSMNMEGIMETARVFGNLTRQKAVRDFLSSNRVDAVMITLLDSGSLELVYIACGVLMNFMTDDEKRCLLKEEGGVIKLTEVLRDFGREDWQLSSIVCKVLCNYSTKIKSASDCFGETEAKELVFILEEYLDQEIALGSALNDSTVEEVGDYICETWQADFKPVAAQLLKRIEAHQSQFEPLEQPA